MHNQTSFSTVREGGLGEGKVEGRGGGGIYAGGLGSWIYPSPPPPLPSRLLFLSNSHCPFFQQKFPTLQNDGSRRELSNGIGSIYNEACALGYSRLQFVYSFTFSSYATTIIFPFLATKICSVLYNDRSRRDDGFGTRVIENGRSRDEL